LYDRLVWGAIGLQNPVVPRDVPSLNNVCIVVCQHCRHFAYSRPRAEIEPAVVGRDVEQIPSVMPYLFGVVQYYHGCASFHRQVCHQASRLGQSVAEDKVKPDTFVVKVLEDRPWLTLENRVPVRRADFRLNFIIPLAVFLLHADDKPAALSEKSRAILAQAELENTVYIEYTVYFLEHRQMAAVIVKFHFLTLLSSETRVTADLSHQFLAANQPYPFYIGSSLINSITRRFLPNESLDDYVVTVYIEGHK
jgi:hypothetical protein